MMAALPDMQLARPPSIDTPVSGVPAGQAALRHQPQARHCRRLSAAISTAVTASSTPSRGVVILPGLGNAAGDYAAISGVPCYRELSSRRQFRRDSKHSMWFNLTRMVRCSYML